MTLYSITREETRKSDQRLLNSNDFLFHFKGKFSRVANMNEFSVQISADLVNRLVNDGENTKRKPRRTKTKVPRESQPQIKVNKKLLDDDSETHKASAAPGWPVENPLFFPATQPVQSANAELDAIRSVIQESEKVVDKLQKQESEMVQEVTGRAKELRDKEFKLPYQKPMPCLADYDACRACYKEHANNILKCAPLAKSYYDCVQRAKHQMSSSDK